MKKQHIVIGVVICTGFIAGAWRVGDAYYSKRVTTVPLPLGASANSSYTIPANLPAKTGGPYKAIADVKRLALEAGAGKGDDQAKVSAIVLTSHSALVNAGVFSQSLSVADDREVYLATVEGEFSVFRGPQGSSISATHLNVEIDATTGEVLAQGTSNITEDIEEVSALQLSQGNLWLNP